MRHAVQTARASDTPEVIAAAHLITLAYFFLLVPSLLVLPYFSKDDVSFNLSGPMALGFAAAYLGGQRMDLGTVRRTLTGLLAPILSLVTVASFSTVFLVLISPEGSCLK